jgi:hypothetical protein
LEHIVSEYEMGQLLAHTVATMTTDHAITKMTLDTIVSFYTIVAFVIPLVPC